MSVLDELLDSTTEGRKESVLGGEHVSSPSGGAVVPPTPMGVSPAGAPPVSRTTQTTERVRTVTPTTMDTKPLRTVTTKIRRYLPSGGGTETAEPSTGSTAVGQSAVPSPSGGAKSVERSGVEVRKPHDQGAVGAKGERFLDVLKRYGATPPTPEQVEEERKRQRNRERIAAIGDAISSIANLYHTTNYAPSAYDPKSSALGAVRAQGDRAKAAQDRDRDAYLQHYMRALQLDNARDDHERSWRHKLEQDRMANERAKAEAERKAKKDEFEQTIKEEEQRLAGKKLDETVRTNKAHEANARKANEISGGHLALARQKHKDSQSKSEKVYLGEYIGYKDIDTDGVPYAYSALPDKYKAMFSVYNPKTRSYEAPDKARMLDALRYVADKDPETAQRVLNIGGHEGMQVTGMKPAPRRFSQSSSGGGQPPKTGTPTPQRRTNMPYLGKQSQAGQAKGKDSRKQDNNIAPWKRK